MQDDAATKPVEVTQEDRNMAADIYRRFRYGVPRLHLNILGGKIDGDPIVQAFARHRLNTRPTTGGEELARLASAFVAAMDECQPYIDRAFFQMANHGMPHTGPQYGEELEALRSALRSTQGEVRSTVGGEEVGK